MRELIPACIFAGEFRFLFLFRRKKGHLVGALFWVCVRRCPTFPPGLGSIIGAGRLSFRVRDGSGRFPVAVAAVTLFNWCGVFTCFGGGVGCGWWVDCGCGVCVSFRPVSASSLRPLRGL